MAFSALCSVQRRLPFLLGLLLVVLFPIWIVSIDNNDATTFLQYQISDPVALHQNGSRNRTTIENFSFRPISSATNNYIHVVVLVHGLMGNAKELLHLERTLKRLDRDHSTSSDKWIVHSATSNEMKTMDGIVAGGHRLAVEVNNLLHEVKQQNLDEKSKITLSIVGSSFGGLYSRYAISEIDFQGVIPLVFCTVSTPHLGVAGNTYVPLPRSIESIAATLLLQSGSDLFRFSNMIDQLTVDDKFIQPLQNFRHRRAYANAFHTDHVVPLRTAAFLSSDIESRHYYRSHDHNNITKAAKKYVSLIVETKKLPRKGDCVNNEERTWRDGDYRTFDTNDSINRLSSDEMSVRLDSLGWTKVFCDMRDNLFPISGWSQGNSKNVVTDTPTIESSSGTVLTPPLPLYQSLGNFPYLGTMRKNTKIKEPQQYQYMSSELLEQYGGSPDKWFIPAGHANLGAHAHFGWYEYLNSGGRPMVEQMAYDLVHQITSRAT